MGDQQTEMVNKSGQEVELKLRVRDLADLIRIAVASDGKILPTLCQSNTFLDTQSRALDAARLVLRLRTERTAQSTRHFVTAKGPRTKSVDGSLTSTAEEETEISLEDADGIRAGKVDPLSFFQPGTALANVTAERAALVAMFQSAAAQSPLGVVGSFTNDRTPVVCRMGNPSFQATLELDRTCFPGDQIQHEVELEVPAGVDPAVAQQALLELFGKAGVVGTSAPGKAKRFFAALRGERLDP